MYLLYILGDEKKIKSPLYLIIQCLYTTIKVYYYKIDYYIWICFKRTNID